MFICSKRRPREIAPPRLISRPFDLRSCMIEGRENSKAMSDQLSNLRYVRKPAIRAEGGIVAAQSRIAAEIGAEVLASGGDCVDAAVATGFALGVLEPWMSGVGGGGAMVLYRAREDRVEVIDYG